VKGDFLREMEERCENLTNDEIVIATQIFGQLRPYFVTERLEGLLVEAVGEFESF
jgi:hypothetical protein